MLVKGYQDNLLPASKKFWRTTEDLRREKQDFFQVGDIIES